MAEIFYGLSLVELQEINPTTGATVGTPIFGVANEEFTLTPEYSEGESEHLRTKDRILAQYREDDLLLGFELGLTQNVFAPEVLSLMGGMVASGEGDTQVIATPLMKDGASTTKPFRAKLYTANYRGNQIIDYGCLTLARCKGKMPEISIGKEFYAPEFEAYVTEDSLNNTPALSISFVKELPDMSEATLALLSPRMPDAVQEQLANKEKSKAKA